MGGFLRPTRDSSLGGTARSQQGPQPGWGWRGSERSPVCFPSVSSRRPGTEFWLRPILDGWRWAKSRFPGEVGLTAVLTSQWCCNGSLTSHGLSLLPTSPPPPPRDQGSVCRAERTGRGGSGEEWERKGEDSGEGREGPRMSRSGGREGGGGRKRKPTHQPLSQPVGTQDSA